MRLSAEEFKKNYPVLAGAGWLRNLIYLDFIEWTTNFEEILIRGTAATSSFLWLAEVDFPLQLVRCMTDQLTEIREKEIRLGTGNTQGA